MPRGAQERPGGILGASQGVLGRPRRAPGAPGVFPRGPRDGQKDARECPGARRGDQNRRQVASGSKKIECFLHGAFAKHHRSDFLMTFFDFWFFCKVCEPLKVLPLPAKTEVRPFALRVESLARCKLEKHENWPENRPKIIENRVSGTLGRPSRSTFVARSASVERLGATRATKEGERAMRSPSG